MWLEAIITKQDFEEVMREVLPAKIDLREQTTPDDLPTDRWIELQTASDVTLVPGRGLRVTCPAELGWSLAGIASPTINIQELRVLLRPEVVSRNKAHFLEFQMEIEEAEVTGIASILDGTITRAANAALAARRLAWNFSKTLSQTLGMGDFAQPLDAMKFDVLWGKQRIGEEALSLVVSFKLHFLRDTPERWVQWRQTGSTSE